MTRAQTPKALRHDARALAKDARALLEATADLTDKKITEARGRLTDALESGKQTLGRLQDQARERIVAAADECVRTHPYESIGVAFALGALVGFLLTRRD